MVISNISVLLKQIFHNYEIALFADGAVLCLHNSHSVLHCYQASLSVELFWVPK
jgi:hypothetical protein